MLAFAKNICMLLIKYFYNSELFSVVLILTELNIEASVHM